MERKHRHLLNVARSLLFQSALPLNFWGESILTVVFLINRLPTSVLKGKSPFEMIYKCLPKFENLRVFGCLCFSVKQNISDKFVERSEKCIFIGYSNEKKGYKLYNLDKSSVFFSRDVVFYEDVFPYKMKKDLINENLFSFFNDSFVNDPLPSSPYDEIVQSSYMDEVPMSETPEISH